MIKLLFSIPSRVLSDNIKVVKEETKSGAQKYLKK